MANEELVKHFECECSGEILRVEHSESDEEYPSVYLAIYNYGYYDETWNLWQKLKYCWRLLRSRTPYGDQIILTPEEAERLANFLLKK